MRLLMFLATIFCGLAASTAQATVMFMTCKDSARSYELRFDDDQGTLISIIDGDAMLAQANKQPEFIAQLLKQFI